MRIGSFKRAAAALVTAALLITVTVPGEAVAVVYQTGVLAFDNFNTDATLTLTECKRSAQNGVWVPESINGRDVTSIAPKAFFSCMEITDIHLPETVSSIGMSAFSHCYMLEAIDLPSYATEIGGSAFSYCSSLEEVMLPDGITSIGSSTFYGCSSLRSVIIPAGVTEIGSSAFTQCPQLREIYFRGTKAEWDQIEIGSPNLELSLCEVICWGEPVGGAVSPGDQPSHEEPGQGEQTGEPVQPTTVYNGSWSGWGVVGGGGGGYGDDLLPGDANGDGRVNVADAVAVLQFIANKSKYPIDGAEYLNADCDGVPGITGSDAQYIQMIDAGLR